MTERVLPEKRLKNVDEMREIGAPLELRCGHCARTAPYPVGRLFIDPEKWDRNEPRSLEDAFGFSGYFHCRFCGKGDSWRLTTSGLLTITALLVEALGNPKRARIHLCKLTLFDGTQSRWPMQGEAHLKGLIEKEPNDYFLWSRLGNLYKASDAPELALEAFTEALKRNENDAESIHSVAQLYEDWGQDEKAVEWYHRFLLRAKHASDYTARTVLRNLVQHALEHLVELHLKSDKKLPLFPITKPEQVDNREEVVVHLGQFDLSKQESWDRMVDQWVGDRAPRPKPVPPSRIPAPRPTGSSLPFRRVVPTQRQVGRNDPCPCGSGKKYKVCCLQK